MYAHLWFFTVFVLYYSANMRYQDPSGTFFSWYHTQIILQCYFLHLQVNQPLPCEIPRMHTNLKHDMGKPHWGEAISWRCWRRVTCIARYDALSSSLQGLKQN